MKKRLYEPHNPYHPPRRRRSLAATMVGKRVGKYLIVEHVYGDQVKALCDKCQRVVERRFCRLKTPCICPIDLTGRYFGMLRVLRHSDRLVAAKDEFVCLCACGRETFASGRHLMCGGKVSCGCIRTQLTVLGTLINRAKQEILK